MRISLFCLLLAFSGLTYAQQITITGKVIDAETKEALPFASVFISGKTVGVVSNAQGEFDFHIPADMRNDILAVSMIGYKTFESPVWSLLTSSTEPAVIELQTMAVLLNEVVVRDTLRAGEILKLAISRIEQNFPMEPFLMEGFYRDLKNLGGTYISLLEAAVKISDDNYQEPRNKYKLRERVALREVRRSLGYSSRFTAFFDKDNLLEDLLLNNSVRYRQFPEEDEFFKTLKFEEDTYYNNREVFVVTHTQNFLLRVYIDKATYGIIHLEYLNEHQQDLEKVRGLESKFAKVKRTIDFKFIDEKLYLNYLTVTSQVNWYDANTGDLKFEAELQRQLLINKIYPKSKERISLAQKMKGYGLQYQDQPYNKTFWDNYNVIKSTPLDKKIIEDLEREEPLEKQFKE
ncbi:MAG: carboxypeptidase-like regulatory domain-containing protein [Bacteroidetes bacterium]|nr:carboxypeptidase-like regulatory domain-containing protein [Bacteroidota bacterium]MBI3482722.1 carboxypeptidase-like regulatory domain-containing protein [Bacteroidota bacterium]